MTTKSTRKVVRVSTLTFVCALHTLMQGPCTAKDLELSTGLHRDTVYELLRAMRKKKVAHISDWTLDSLGRRSVAVFTLGAGLDEKRGA